MAYFKITVQWNQQNLGKALNVFYFRNASGNPTDAQLISEAESYLEDIYTPLLPSMDSGCTFLSAELLEVNLGNETIRIVGSLAPSLVTTGGSEQLALTTAGSMFARTAFPKTRGSKRMPGIEEGAQNDGLFNNGFLNALAESALAYVSTRGSILTWLFEPGVIRTTTEVWADFSGVAVVTNIPGTQVTRKPLRGA